jgi:PPOX class probable F420-dependent enzyme
VIVASLGDPEVRELLDDRNHAVVSTLNRDGSIHSTIVWINREDDVVAINSRVGRIWPNNLERDPHVTVLVFEAGNPYRFLEIRGTVTAVLGPAADDHINLLAKKYTGQDVFRDRRPGDERIKFVIKPDHIRHAVQG